MDDLPSFSGKKLACHCQLNEACHGDNLIREFARRVHPEPKGPQHPTDQEARDAAEKRGWATGDWEDKENSSSAPGCDQLRFRRTLLGRSRPILEEIG